MPGEERLDLPCSVRSKLAGQVLEERRVEAAGGRRDTEVVEAVAEGRSTGELFPRGSLHGGGSELTFG